MPGQERFQLAPAIDMRVGDAKPVAIFAVVPAHLYASTARRAVVARRLANVCPTVAEQQQWVGHPAPTRINGLVTQTGAAVEIDFQHAVAAYSRPLNQLMATLSISPQADSTRLWSGLLRSMSVVTWRHLINGPVRIILGFLLPSTLQQLPRRRMAQQM